LSDARKKSEFLENSIKNSFNEYQSCMKDIKESEDKYKRAEKNE